MDILVTKRSNPCINLNLGSYRLNWTRTRVSNDPDNFSEWIKPEKILFLQLLRNPPIQKNNAALCTQNREYVYHINAVGFSSPRHKA